MNGSPVVRKCEDAPTVSRSIGTKKDAQREYRAWVRMKNRCRDLSKIYYGGKGIKVCDRWLHNYDTFLLDMGRMPPDKCSLDRIDGNKDYSPDNCRWATMKEQHNNQRSNIQLTYNGVTKPLQVWAEQLGINPDTMTVRRLRGWPVEKILTTPVKKIRVA